MYVVASVDEAFVSRIKASEVEMLSNRRILFRANNAGGLRSVREVKYNFIVIDTDQTSFDLTLYLKSIRNGVKEINQLSTIILVAENIDKKYVERYCKYVNYISLKSTFDFDKVLIKLAAG